MNETFGTSGATSDMRRLTTFAAGAALATVLAQSLVLGDRMESLAEPFVLALRFIFLTLAWGACLRRVTPRGLPAWAYRIGVAGDAAIAFVAATGAGADPVLPWVRVAWLIALAATFAVALPASATRRAAAASSAVLVAVIGAVALPGFSENLVRPVFGMQAPGVEFAGSLTFALAILVTHLLDRFAAVRDSLLRIEHALPWFFVLLLGGLFRGEPGPTLAWTAAVVLLLHMTVIVVNDYYDRRTDGDERRSTGVGAEDVWLLNFGFIAVAVSFLLNGGVVPGILLALYFVSTLAYHHDSTRLKHICPINYKIEGVVGALAYTLGMVVNRPEFHFASEDLFSIFLVFGGFSLVSMFKDYKDVDADSSGRIFTVYVVLRRRGWPIARIHRIVRGLVFACLMIPPLILPLPPASRLALVVVATGLVTALGRGAPKQAVRRGLWVLNVYLALLTMSALGVAR